MDSDNGVEGQRIASSMSDHVQLLLDLNQKNLDGQMDGTPMSEHQVAILKRALAAGGRVSRADYEQASEGVVDCLHRNNLVKASCTAKDYDTENRRFDKYWNDRRMGRAPTIAETHGHFSFDYSDVDAATCLANNHEAWMFRNTNRRNGSHSDSGRRWMALAMGTTIETIHHPDRG